MFWFEAIDRKMMQYLCWSIITLFSLIIIPFIFNHKEIKKTALDPLFLIFSGFLVFATISTSASINIIESYVRLGQLLSFHLSLFIVILIARQKLVKINFILFLFAISLILDVFLSLRGYAGMYINNIDYSYKYINNLLGIFGNRNLLAASILFRLPLFVLFAQRLNNRVFYVFTFIFISICFFDLFLLSSRTAFLAMILCFIYFVIISVYRLYKNRVKMLSLNRGVLFLLILPLIVGYYMSSYAIESNDYANVGSRISSIASTKDESKNRRLLFYGHAFEHIKENPLFGCGIGNWKILSVKYDAENMENYVVPFNTHNDILEISAETGIFGGILFISFFMFIFYLVFKSVDLKSHNMHHYSELILLPMPIICYFTDLNLNFPSNRPLFLYLLLLFIMILYIYNPKQIEK
tara:strand:- start:209 stop:1438 length:1230 start_codon:yes stop_codon:yes gene_type:complete